jgi:hypothetical protein
MDLRICTTCGTEKPATTDNFYPSPRGKFGVRSKCISCEKAGLKTSRDDALRAREATASQRWRDAHPERHALATFRMHVKKAGLDLDLIEPLWLVHDGLCDICRRPERGVKKRLSVEHDHVTGEFRGFVCGRCNTMIGMADDDVSVLEAAIDYLKRSRPLLPRTRVT